MYKEIGVCFLLLITFTIGSIYNIKIRKQCIYPVKLTKPRLIVSIIIMFIFCLIAYIGGNLWYYYILALAASIFIISSIVGEGIHEKGIYYYTSKRTIARLAKWQDIKDIEIDINKNKLQSFKFQSTRIYPDQYYRQEDITEIKKITDERVYNK